MVKKSLLKWILKLCHRVEVSGMEHYQAAGEKVLYVINPSSLIDPLLLAVFLPKEMTFIIDSHLGKKWYMLPIYAVSHVIEVDFSSPNATRQIVQTLKENSHCMVFHDAQFVTDTSLMKIYEATALIVSKTGATLLPIKIDGAAYSRYSYFQHKVRLSTFPKISMTILPPQQVEEKTGISQREQRKALASFLHSLMSDLRYRSTFIEQSILDSLKAAIKLYGKGKIVAEDQDRITLSYGNLFLKAQALGAAIHKLTLEERHVGLLMPNALASVVAFVGMHLNRHVPAMLNFTSGPVAVIAACETVQLKTIITSKKFVIAGELQPLITALKEAHLRILYLEDIAVKISLVTKIKAAIKSLTLSIPKIDPQEPVAVLFTSGSEGKPKAVFMSHRNVKANHEQMLSIIDITSADRFFNCLPMFHTFGLSVCTLLPILNGMRVFLYPSPLHYRIVPQLFYESLSTFICGTDTFFTGYARYGKPYDFFNVRYMIAGAEKLRETTAKTYEEKFGVHILEGYGATETSPVLSVNTPANSRSKSVGKILPGIEFCLSPIEGLEKGGELCVRGDNIMLGYMHHSNPGVIEPPKEGWHNLGDIVEVDNENYIFIKGRAKRFAKIGGEMVSLTAVEQALEPLLHETLYGVVSIPDEKKGETIVLITEKQDISPSSISTYFATKGFPTLWVPKKIMTLKAAPVLGTGKFDYAEAKNIAMKS